MDSTSEKIEHKLPICDRIPSLDDLERNSMQPSDKHIQIIKRNAYRYFDKEHLSKRLRKEYNLYNFCFLSVCISFMLGLVIGILLVSTNRHLENFRPNDNRGTESPLIRSLNEIRKPEQILKANKYPAVSFTDRKYKKEHNQNKETIYPKGLTEDMKEILKDQKNTRHEIKLNNTAIPMTDKTILFDNIFWGPAVENLMPQGYGINSADIWEKYVNQNEIVKIEDGCGRMQNRLVTFEDGLQACVRYRQNTDQIQGEIFSFYVAGLLNLTNLAPAVIKIVDVKDKLWKNVASDIASAEWASNRAVVLTQYIPSLEPAKIPNIFKPTNRHLNKNDVYSIVAKENETDLLTEKLKHKKVNKTKINNQIFDHIEMNLNKKTSDLFVELAQWSDLIIFDYLTANLDRIVNNLFNYQWNINIMDGPAHNLARKMDSGLLVFLDNESGLLHGYRLLKKYNVYHSAMLDNLCVFRKRTIDSLKRLYKSNVGSVISDMFHRKNNAVVRDILPPLPEKNTKVLHERIGHVLSQVDQCEEKFNNR